MTKIVILGAGNIGKAIETLLKTSSQVQLELSDQDHAKAPGQKPLAEIIPEADFIFLCVPSWGMRQAIENLKPHLKNPETIFISSAKGIEEKTFKTMDALLLELLPEKPLVMISGPMLARELSEGKFGSAVAACEKKEVFQKVAELFQNSNLKIEYSKSLRGAALIGVLKNVYSLLIGMADGLNSGHNFRGWLIVKTLQEMEKIIESLGGDKQIVYSSAGIGDFVATAFSPDSRNRKAGEELAKQQKTSTESEGLASIQPLLKMLGSKIEDLPFLKAISAGIAEPKEIPRLLKNL